MVRGEADAVLGGAKHIGEEGCAMMPGLIGSEPDADGLLELARIYTLDRNTRRQNFHAQAQLLKQLWAVPLKWFLQKMDLSASGWSDRKLDWVGMALTDPLLVFRDNEAFCWGLFAQLLVSLDAVEVTQWYCDRRFACVRAKKGTSYVEMMARLDQHRPCISKSVGEHEALCQVIARVAEAKQEIDKGGKKLSKSIKPKESEIAIHLFESESKSALSA